MSAKNKYDKGKADSILFEEMNAFFCFSPKQFDESKIEGVKYVNLGSGLFCPKGNEKKLLDGLEKNYLEGIKKDLEENSVKDIIWRELANYETQISMDISNTVEALQDYNITKEQIKKEYRLYLNHCIKNDLF